MNHLFTGLIGSCVWFGGIILDEHTAVPVGAVMAVGSGMWWLSSKLQSMEDRIKELSSKLHELPCHSDPAKCAKHKVY
jgi:hypothetical protein